MARGGGRRTYVRDGNGRFASTPGGGAPKRSTPATRRAAMRAGNRLNRDNAGRITGIGRDGATVRGGRLRTAAGNRRATQTASMKAAGFRPGVIAKGGRGVSGKVARSLAAARKERMAGAKLASKPPLPPKPADKNPSPRTDGRTWQLTKGRDSLRKQLKEIRQQIKEAGPSAGGLRLKKLQIQDRLNQLNRDLVQAGATTAVRRLDKPKPPTPRKPTPKGPGPRTRAARPAGTVAKPKGLKPGALAERRGKKTAAAKPKAGPGSLQAIAARRARVTKGIKQQQARMMQLLRSGSMDSLSRSEEKRMTRSAIIRSAANEIYNRQRTVAKISGKELDRIVLSQPLAIMRTIRGSKDKREMAIQLRERAHARVIKGRKGRR